MKLLVTELIRTTIVRQRPFRTVYDTLSLTNSSLSTADSILWCTKILFPNYDFHFFFRKKNCNPLLLLCPLCPTYPPAHPLNLIYILLIPWQKKVYLFDKFHIK